MIYRILFLLAALAALPVASKGQVTESPAQHAPADPSAFSENESHGESDDDHTTKTTVVLTVDFGNGFQMRYVDLPWQAGDTVRDAMDHAAKHEHALRFTTRGKGATAFLLSIDGVENQGGGRKNWMFEVGGQMAKQSFATTKVEQGADILWQFRHFK